MRDFTTLFKEGQFVAGDLVTAKVWSIDPAKYPRRRYALDDLKIGIVVGLSVSKKAVVRNRVKRQMREVIRLLLLEGRIKSGVLVAFVAKKSVIDQEYRAIEASMFQVLRRAGLLQKSSIPLQPPPPPSSSEDLRPFQGGE